MMSGDWRDEQSRERDQREMPGPQNVDQFS